MARGKSAREHARRKRAREKRRQRRIEATSLVDGSTAFRGINRSVASESLLGWSWRQEEEEEEKLFCVNCGVYFVDTNSSTPQTCFPCYIRRAIDLEELEVVAGV